MVHFCIALPCEAQSVIRKFGMKPCGGHGRAQFFEGEGTRLAVTGIGQLASAIATTALGARYPEKNAIWVNLGICGHKSAPIGSCFIANRLESPLSLDRLYPQLPWKGDFAGISLRTLDQPTTDYPEHAAVDMEGFGFYKAALAFASTEFVHCIKIVSDNASNPANEVFDKAFVSKLVETSLPQIASFCDSLAESRPAAECSQWRSAMESEAKERFALTETERHQLRNRLGKLDVLLDSSAKEQASAWIGEARNKKRFLAQLEIAIDSATATAIG